MANNSTLILPLSLLLVCILPGCPDEQHDSNARSIDPRDASLDAHIDPRDAADLGPDNTPDAMPDIGPDRRITVCQSDTLHTDCRQDPIDEPPDDPSICWVAPGQELRSPASIISQLRIPAGDQESCCFDYDGRPGDDNALALLLRQDQRQELNAALGEQINAGERLFVLEHAGYDGVCSAYDLNILEARLDGTERIDEDGANTVMINPASFEVGTRPESWISGATIAEDALTTGFGRARLVLELPSLPGQRFEVLLTAAKISAKVDASRSDLRDGRGVALPEGKLGGILQARDLLDELNRIADRCTCYQKDGATFTDPLIEFSDDLSAIRCVGDVDTAGCEGAEATELDEACSAFAASACSFLPDLADALDTNPDHLGEDCAEALDFNCTGLSVGLTFEADGARITGLDR